MSSVRWDSAACEANHTGLFKRGFVNKCGNGEHPTNAFGAGVLKFIENRLGEDEPEHLGSHPALAPFACAVPPCNSAHMASTRARNSAVNCSYAFSEACSSGGGSIGSPNAILSGANL